MYGKPCLARSARRDPFEIRTGFLETCSMSPQPGDIWLADLGLPAKTRPVVIVSSRDPDPPRALVLYVPLTTQSRHSPYEVPPRLPFLDRESVANVQGLGSLPTVRLERKIVGQLSSRLR